MNRLIPASAATILFLLVMCLNCFAIGLPISNEDLILESQDVFHGIVKEVRCAEEGGKGRIFSYITIEVLDMFKGEPRDEIVVRLAGGTIGDNRTKEQPSVNDSTSEVLSSLPGVHIDSLGAFHFRKDGRITLVVEDEAELEEGMEVIIHTYLTVNGNLVINNGARGVYEIKDGIVDHMDMTIDQYRDFVGEVTSKDKADVEDIEDTDPQQ